MHVGCVKNFSQWRDQARQYLAAGVAPGQILWTQDPQQPTLLDDQPQPEGGCDNDRKNSVGVRGTEKVAAPSVPKSFLELAKSVSCHRNPDRWQVLYRTLWRLTHGERWLLDLSTDDDVLTLARMQKAVRRDAHKMKAFVRFRKVESKNEVHYIAWHRPDHQIVQLVAPFFSRRFKAMNWSIFTPNESVHWDQKQLHFGPGVPRCHAPKHDELEELWLTYYKSIFNPARVKVAMMKSEMPMRHWPTLPEAALIPQLLRESSQRVDEMVDHKEGFANTASQYIPTKVQTWDELARAARGCQACDLCHHASQVVFGNGPKDASVVLVGEQPGDREDLEGRPFVGPAGELLDSILQRIGISRSDIYVTNTVKHFKHVQRGKHRLHKKPNAREIYACRPWLEAELSIIKPTFMVCLGTTATQAILGRDIQLTGIRGRVVKSDWCGRTIATWHPAAILRMPDKDRRMQMMDQLTSDLRLASLP